jgi:hypothetical protein
MASLLPEGIEGAAFDQAFDHTLVDLPRVDLSAEMIERLKFPLTVPGFDDGVNGADADIFNGGKAETNMGAGHAEIPQR